MAKNYYYLVASLPELALDDTKLNYSIDDFKTDIYPALSSTDKELIDLFLCQYDNKNVLCLLSNKEDFDKRGKYTADELVEYIDAIKEGNIINPLQFPSYLAKFIADFYQQSLHEDVLIEDRLTSLYFDYARGCKNEFVSQWFEYNLNINNILVALISRKYQWNVVDGVIGNTEICDALRTSGARDFGIANEVDYFDTVLKISEETELVEREKRLDLLRWNWMDDNSFFAYFSIEKLFVFIVQIEMIERWISLDKDMGNTIFRNIIDGLKDEVQIPAEFR